MIDCFVNFLSLPGGADDNENSKKIIVGDEGWVPKPLDLDLDQVTWLRHHGESTHSQDTQYSAENSIQLRKPNAVADVYRVCKMLFLLFFLSLQKFITQPEICDGLFFFFGNKIT